MQHINKTVQTLIEQMRITEFEIDNRKKIISLTDKDAEILKSFKPMIEEKLNSIISRFYEMQTKIPEIELLIGDSGTLERLKTAQRLYILDLFSGIYDMEYVNNRCRIGLVHKRIGVEPKFYLSGILCLKEMLSIVIEESIIDKIQAQKVWSALDKIVMFDITLVFDTYIRSLVSEIEIEKDKSDAYAMSLETKVRARTKELDELSRLDPLTGLLNTRQLSSTLEKVLSNTQRRKESLTVLYIDVNDFKIVNDTLGHQRGDEVLQEVGHAISDCARLEDFCFRYGGDEFFVILTNCTAQQARDIYVTNLEKRMSTLDISLSIGVAEMEAGHPITEAALIKQADENMYSNKKIHKAKKLVATEQTTIDS